MVLKTVLPVLFYWLIVIVCWTIAVWHPIFLLHKPINMNKLASSWCISLWSCCKQIATSMLNNQLRDKREIDLHVNMVVSGNRNAENNHRFWSCDVRTTGGLLCVSRCFNLAGAQNFLLSRFQHALKRECCAQFFFRDSLKVLFI